MRQRGAPNRGALSAQCSAATVVVVALPRPAAPGRPRGACAHAVCSMEALQTSLELALCDWRRFSEVGLGGWGDGSANRRVQKLLDRLDGGQALASEEAYIAAMKREFPV